MVTGGKDDRSASTGETKPPELRPSLSRTSPRYRANIDKDAGVNIEHRRALRCLSFRAGSASVKGETAAIPAGFFVSPVDADLSSLPPVTIHASSDELLLPDAELMAKRLDVAGIRCDLHLWDGQIHDFPLAADVLPEARRAIRYIGDFVKEVTAEPDAWSQRSAQTVATA
jgi:acetyl esterase/lipase